MLFCEFLDSKIIANGNQLSSHAFNFGPPLNQKKSVLELIEKIHSIWPGEYHFDKNSIYHHESETLSLSIDKTKKFLNWNPKLTFDLSVELTINWYKNFYLNSIPAMDICLQDIKNYLSK